MKVDDKEKSAFRGGRSVRNEWIARPHAYRRAISVGYVVTHLINRPARGAYFNIRGTGGKAPFPFGVAFGQTPTPRAKALLYTKIWAYERSPWAKRPFPLLGTQHGNFN